MNNTENTTAREVTKIQIFRFVAKDKRFWTSAICSRSTRSAASWPSRSSSSTSNYKATQRVRHYVDADDFKLVCHDLLAGTFTQFEDQKGSAHDDHTEARVLSLEEGSRSTGSPIVLRIDNGQGEVYGNGQVKMVNATDSLTIQMPEFEARKMALVVLDYIQQWEMIHFRKRQEARTVSFTPSAEAAPAEQREETALAA